MAYKKIVMELDEKIALVAHDNKKRDLIEWAKFHRDLLAHHKVYAPGLTGLMLEEELSFPVTKLQSGRLGGDQRMAPCRSRPLCDFPPAADGYEPKPH